MEIEYIFVYSSKTNIYDTFFPKKKIQALFEHYYNKYKNTYQQREYTVYNYENMYLYLYPDGSSYCNQIIQKRIIDTKYPTMLTLYHHIKKLPNDQFLNKFQYDFIHDIIEIIFPIQSQLKVIIKTIYNNEQTCPLESYIKDTKDITHWIEITLQVHTKCNIADVHETIQEINEILQG